MAPIMLSEGSEVWTSDFLDNLLRTMIITIYETEASKNTAQGAIAVTIKPPTVGPTARPMLLATALRVRAAGNSDLDTSALMVGIIGVLIIVVPAPSAKVSINNKEGVVISRKVSIASIIDTVNMYPHVMRSISRRSKMSDNAPDGKAKRNIGRVLAVVIRETNKGFGASEVISHDAATSYIAAPIYEKRAANQKAPYMLYLKGLKPDAEILYFGSLLPLSTIVHN
jgi:hypothetical protein